MPRTGQLIRIVFTEQWEELRGEPLLRQLRQRIKDVQKGPDGLLDVITGEAEAALIRIEPVSSGGASNAPDSK